MFVLDINGKKYEYNLPVKLLDIAPKHSKNALVAKVNGRIRELDFYVYSDSFVEFVDATNQEAVKIYEATLRYVILKALCELLPNKRVVVSNYVSRSVKFHIRNYVMTEADSVKLQNKVAEIVKKDIPIVKKRISKEELLSHYHDQNYFEKIRLLQDLKKDTLKAYECDGYYNYMFSMMLPSTGYVARYEIQPYANGYIVQYPRFEAKGDIPEFQMANNYLNMINDENKWVKQLGIRSLADLNDLISTKQGLIDFVNVCETKHNDNLSEIGNIIFNKKEEIKLIAIAGPSSSGKTTFCNRVRIELLSKGIKTLMISIDDYYRNRNEYPIDEFGNKDYEHIESLNLELFNEHLFKLLNGEEIELPTFDFDKGLSSKSGRFVKLEKDQVILIEGIHALNERLTEAIPREKKFKIFISPHSMYNFDNHNPFSASDVRLLRRIVRDKLFRGATPEHTLDLWGNVRRGEFKWIYPFQDESDYTFNTELTYEIMVMKKYALPTLLTVKKSSPYYYGVKMLVDLLENVNDIEDKYVPCNSILREFIGGSCFYD